MNGDGRRHLPEYLIEAAGLGLFMLSAATFATLLESAQSPVRAAIGDPWLRRLLMGTAMGLTLVLIVYSPWGRRSGAHINPAVTLTFYRLGKVSSRDATHYIVAQVVGGVAGLMIAWALLGNVLAQPEIRFVATLPTGGAAAALAAEFVISFVTMLVVLVSTNGSSRGRYTGLIVGGLVAIYITFEQPLSGMSMNPARSFASALPSGAWHGFWIYVVAPLAGMLAAAEIHPRLRGASAVRCAKLNHDNDQPCIFRCGYCVHGASGADRAA